MAQQCNMEEIQTNKFSWMFACVILFICVLVVFAAFWRKFQSFVKSWDDRMKRLESDVGSVQVRCNWEITMNMLEIWETNLDSVDIRCESIDEALDAQAARAATSEEGTTESSHTTREAINCLRFGLMELGGFVRHTILSREQRSHMFVQERANMVFWNLRNRADTTDANLEDHREGGEEESRTVDPVVEPETHRSHGRISSLLEHVRRDLDIALQAERWTEANQLLWTLQAVQVRKDRRWELWGTWDTFFRCFTVSTGTESWMSAWKGFKFMLKTWTHWCNDGKDTGTDMLLQQTMAGHALKGWTLIGALKFQRRNTKICRSYSCPKLARMTQHKSRWI